MTITFENDNDVIVYALEKIISYARKTQQIFVAQCVWWLASIIGLEQGLIVHIDNLRKRTTDVQEPISTKASEPEASVVQDSEVPEFGKVHPNSVQQILSVGTVSPTPRDLTENRRLNQVLESAEQVVQESIRDRTTRQRNRVNPLPQTKMQLRKARKVKRLQEARTKEAAERNERLQEIRASVIQYMSKE